MIDLIVYVLELPVWAKVTWFAGTSIVAYLLMFWDKLSAMKGWWRTQEKNLLLLAAVGGGVGAKVGQRAFRHKTRKEPFRTRLNAAFLFSVFLILVVFLAPVELLQSR